MFFLNLETVIMVSCMYTSIKMKVGCRNDTVPKTVNTRRHCEEE